MVTLTGDQRKRIQAAFLSAFRHYPELERMVSFGLNENLAAIADETSDLSDVVFCLIEWAEAQGRVPDLLRAACAERYANPALDTIAGELGVNCGKQATVQTRTRAVAPWQWAAVTVPVILAILVLIARSPFGESGARIPTVLVPTVAPTATIPSPTWTPVAPTATIPPPTWTPIPSATPSGPTVSCGTAQSCFSLGVAQKQKGDSLVGADAIPVWHQAIAFYNRALELDPNYADAYNNRGYAYDRLGQYDAAVRDYGQAIALDTRNGIFYYGRGSSYYRWGISDATKFAPAVTDLSTAISLPEDRFFAYHPYAYYFRGSAHRRQNERDQALADLTSAWQLCSDRFLRGDIAAEFSALNTPLPAAPANCPP